MTKPEMVWVRGKGLVPKDSIPASEVQAAKRAARAWPLILGIIAGGFGGLLFGLLVGPLILAAMAVDGGPPPNIAVFVAVALPIVLAVAGAVLLGRLMSRIK